MAAGRDRVARNLFVDRVKTVYTASLTKELSSGTAISHGAQFGLDPARLLREGDEDTERETKKLLQLHVAEKLYFMKNIVWEIGAEGYKEKNNKARQRAAAARMKTIKGIGTALYLVTAGAVISMAAAIEAKLLEAKEKAARKIRERREGVLESGPIAEKYRKKDDDKPTKDGPTRLQKMKAKLKELSRGGMAVGISAAADLEDEKVERLDETYREPDSDEETPEGDGGGKPGIGGDTLLGPLGIDDYMLFRTRPLITYIERTVPWRAFELQLLEIIVFCFNSLGAIFVGMQQAAYVPLSVAAAAIISSFMDFTNLGKQVEAYNTAVNNLHNLVNEWDGKTRTERRTRQTVTKVVGVTEEAWLNVGVALTNGTLTGSAADDEGDGEEGEDK